MAYADLTRTAPVGLPTRLVARTIGAAAAWYRANATRKVLNKLSERELDDIGLTRADIEAVVARQGAQF